MAVLVWDRLTYQHPQTLSERLTWCREVLGLQQRHVAQSAALHPVSLSNYEHGKNEPPTAAVAVLADRYGVSVDALLGREPLRLTFYANPADEPACPHGKKPCVPVEVAP